MTEYWWPSWAAPALCALAWVAFLGYARLLYVRLLLGPATQSLDEED